MNVAQTIAPEVQNTTIQNLLAALRIINDYEVKREISYEGSILNDEPFYLLELRGWYVQLMPLFTTPGIRVKELSAKRSGAETLVSVHLTLDQDTAQA